MRGRMLQSQYHHWNRTAWAELPGAGFTPVTSTGMAFSTLRLPARMATEAVAHILHGDGSGRFNAVMRHVLGEGGIYAHGKVALGDLDGDSYPAI